MTALTITRPYNGIGDWLFCLAVLKFVNRQRPDVECFVDFDHIQVGRLPYLIPDLYGYADVRFKHGMGPENALVTRDSLVYRRWPPDSFIESTVMHLNDQTNLGIEYEPDVLPSFGIRHHGSGGYVVMIGQGKRRNRVGKEWGWGNFQQLAFDLGREGIETVQVGHPEDMHLTRVGRVATGLDTPELLELMCGARLFIGIENGITVLAGYLGVPSLTIYDGHGFPQRMTLPNQTKIVEKVEPDVVVARVLSMLKEGPCSSSNVFAVAATAS